tara:strand:- start:1091 stop:1798 length:708 start_codon:yes stop_codon:yes gene_type:complete
MSPLAPERPNTTQIGDQPLNLRRAIEQSRLGTGFNDMEQAKKVAMMLKAMKMQQEEEERQRPPEVSRPIDMPDPTDTPNFRPPVEEIPGYQGPDPLPTVETPPEDKRRTGGMYLDDGTFLPGVPNSQGGVDVGTPGFLAQFQNNPAIMQLLQQLGYNMENMELPTPEIGMNAIPPVQNNFDPTPPVDNYPVPPVRYEPEPRVPPVPNDLIPPQPSYPFDENPPSDDLMYRLGYGR